MESFYPSTNRKPSLPHVLLGLALVVCVATGTVLAAQSKRNFDVSARKYRFTVSGTDVPEIRVSLNDLVRITLSSEDIPHSFTLPEYRIQKRVEPGHPVTFDFRAEKVGSFDFFCSLTNDTCQEHGMAGKLIVVGR